MLRLLFMLLISCAAPETAPGQTRISCGESEVTVAAGDIDEAESACEIVLRADIWLRQLGLTLKDSLSAVIDCETEFVSDFDA